MKRFVILSAARSGTSLLSETLNTHPQIVCHGEIFHPNPHWHIKGNLAHLSEEDKLRKRENLPDFIEEIYNQPGAEAVGFKMWLDQNPKWCNYALHNESYLKIIYERKNKLAQFSSGILARKTGVWNLGPSEKKQLSTDDGIEFNAKGFDEFLKHQETVFQHYRREARGPILDIDYSQIAQGNFDPVLDFLGVEKVNLSHQKRKLYSSNILERFKKDHHQKILEKLNELGHPEWQTE